jgi:hypothetical protein
VTLTTGRKTGMDRHPEVCGRKTTVRPQAVGLRVDRQAGYR